MVLLISLFSQSGTGRIRTGVNHLAGPRRYTTETTVIHSEKELLVVQTRTSVTTSVNVEAFNPRHHPPSYVQGLPVAQTPSTRSEHDPRITFRHNNVSKQSHRTKYF
jgi:hypothetical protein